MYDAMWYGYNAGIIAMVLESLKMLDFAQLRKDARFNKWYLISIHAVALAFAMVIAFGAKADAFLAVGTSGFHPYAGYVVSGALLFLGDKVLDKVWDNKTVLSMFIDMLKTTLTQKAKGNPNG